MPLERPVPKTLRGLWKRALVWPAPGATDPEHLHRHVEWPNSVVVSIVGELDMADGDQVGKILIDVAVTGSRSFGSNSPV